MNPRSYRSAAGRTVGIVLRWISYVEAVTGGLLVSLLFVLMLMHAAQRYLPVTAWVWTGELARFSLVWLTFAMAGHLMGRDEHVTLRVIDHLGGPVVQRVVAVASNLAVAATCAATAYAAYDLLAMPALRESPGLGMPMKWLYLIPLIGMVLTLLRAVVAVFSPPRNTSTNDASESAPSERGVDRDGVPEVKGETG